MIVAGLDPHQIARDTYPIIAVSVLPHHTTFRIPGATVDRGPCLHPLVLRDVRYTALYPYGHKQDSDFRDQIFFL